MKRPDAWHDAPRKSEAEFNAAFAAILASKEDSNND